MTGSGTNPAPRVALERATDGTLRVRLSGRWALADGVPRVDEVVAS